MGKTSTQKNVTQNTVDPTLVARQNQLWNQAAGPNGLLNQPYQPYTGDRFAGFNPDQNASFDLARTASTAGQAGTDQAMQMAGLLGNFTPQQVQAMQAQGPGAINAQQINAAGIGSGMPGTYTPGSVGARDVTAGKFTDANLNAYMNPFIGSVVDTNAADIERSRLMAANAGELTAAGQGAFGGSRHGVADSLTNAEALRASAASSAGLRKAGFDAAAGLISGDQNRDLSAQQGNQQADIASGTANVNAGLQAAGLNSSNALALGNQRLQALMANQGADLAAQGQNAGISADMSRFNAGQDLNAQGMNQGAGISAAGIRANAAGMLGSLAGQKQGLMGQGADLLNRVGGQQQALGQAQKDFQYQQFLESIQDPILKMQMKNQLLQSGQYGSTSTNTQTQKGSALGTVLGIGSTLAGIPGLGGALGGLLGGGGGIPAAPQDPLGQNWRMPTSLYGG